MDVKKAITSIIAAHKAIPLENVLQDIVEAGELLGERTDNMKVFDAGNGQRRAHIYACPVHFKDTDGSFKSIDPTVKRKPLLDALQTHKYETKSGAYHVHFNADKPWNYLFVVGDNFVEYEALFDESESLTIDVETTLTGIKEIITLKDNKAPTILSWKVTQSEEKSTIINPPPTAKSDNGRNVPIKVSQNEDILTYDIDTYNAIYPIIIDPTSSYYSLIDGYIENSEANWDTCHDAIAGDTINKTGTSIAISSQLFAEVYYIQRGFFTINTAGLPDDAVISAATFNFYVKTSTLNSGIVIRFILTSQYYDNLVIGDYDLVGSIAGATADLTITTTGWKVMTLNATGIGWIQRVLYTTLGLREVTHDIGDSAPTDALQLIVASIEDTGYVPYLSITYTNAPTVQTQTTTNIGLSSCTGNGNILNTGGVNCTRRGFCYMVGTSGDPTTANSVAYYDGSFGAGPYSKDITGLNIGTGYRIRAYAVNPIGTGYGNTYQIYTWGAISAIKLSFQVIGRGIGLF